MVEDGRSAAPDGAPRRSGGATRGFLFSDLRGYTRFVDLHGAAAAADLLERYRALVRQAVALHEGAEIRTEGDSFYVVFPSVSEALACGLDIVAAARTASAPPAQPIQLGVGVHAGETLETPEGYVGQPVNIAARLCAMAPPGEVFLTDTVRALTASVLPVRFVSRGRRRLKGIKEPIQLYAAQPGDVPAPGPRRVSGRWLAIAAAGIAVAGAALIWAAQRPPTAPPGPWTIGLSLPLTGYLAPEVEPLRRAVELAVADLTAAGSLAGVEVVIAPRDDGGGEFGEDDQRAAANATALAADPSAIAMIGPWGSFSAARQIPITNRAGLLHCSPTNTDPRLTKPRAGALDLRSAFPERINYVRLPAAADIESAAGASFAFHDLGSDHALVIDDTLEVGRLVADGFQGEFEALGGRVVRRALNPGSDPADVMDLLGSAGGPTLVFFGGFTNSGAPAVRGAMVEAGLGETPFLGWDGLWDGSGAENGSFINVAGPAAAGSYASHPTVGTVSANFDRRYREAYGDLPGRIVYEYAAASYACAEIVLESLEEAISAGTSAAGMREAVRANVVGRSTPFETAVGGVSFDINGDAQRQIVSFYQVQPTAAGGAGDWVILKEQDFGPAP